MDGLCFHNNLNYLCLCWIEKKTISTSKGVLIEPTMVNITSGCNCVKEFKRDVIACVPTLQQSEAGIGFCRDAYK